MLGIALLAVSLAQPLAEFANYHRQITGRDPAEGAFAELMEELAK